jgi:signal transduction histidine kinase
MSSRKKAQIAFASAVTLLVLSGVAAYVSIIRLLESQRLVQHTLEVQSAIGDYINATAKVGRAAAAFVATADPDLLDDFDQYVAEVPASLQRLRQITSDNPSHQAIWRRLEIVTQQRMSLFSNAVQLKKRFPKDEQGQANIRLESAPFSSETTNLISQMYDQEQKLLAARKRTSSHVLDVTVLILVFAFAMALTLFSINYWLLSEELRARERAEQASRGLSTHLIKLQDEERRKFSRELHDSLGQYLAGLKMSFTKLAENHPEDNRYAECMKMLDQSMAETRTISHLLHPPMLDIAGFCSTARSYVQEFSQRSGVAMKTDIPESVRRLPPAIELALFRVLQESLGNIHRHAKSARAEVGLKLSPRKVVLTIRDFGTGVPQDILQRFKSDGTSGVGLAGMRERVRELGGEFDIDSGASGTIVRVSLPIAMEKLAADASAAD